MYTWKIDPKTSRVDYQSFLRDLTRVAKEGVAQRTQPNVAEARRGLPRPARFKGRNAPTVRDMHRSLGAIRNMPSLRLLQEWTDHRFDPFKYFRALEGLLSETDASNLYEMLGPIFWNDGKMVLDFDITNGVWSFDLYDGDVNVAGSGFACAKRMVRQTLAQLSDNPPDWIKPLLQMYFFTGEKFDGSNKSLQILHQIRKVYSSVDAAVSEGHHSTILCKSDGRSESGRTSLAYVNPYAPIRDGAMIFLGNAFFRASSATGGAELEGERGCTILHEATHLFAGTDDVMYKGKASKAYGRENCFKLPSALALKNADSFGLFAHDVHRYLLRGAYPADLHKAVEIGSFSIWADNAQLETW